MTTNIKRCLYGICTLLLCSSFSYKNEPKVKSAQWQILHSTDQILIRYRYDECDLPSQGTKNENVYLQIRNKSEARLKVEWDQEYWYNGKCTGCEASSENHKVVVLDPLETKEGNCRENTLNELKIFSRSLGASARAELNDFQLKNIQVSNPAN